MIFSLSLSLYFVEGKKISYPNKADKNKSGAKKKTLQTLRVLINQLIGVTLKRREARKKGAEN